MIASMTGFGAATGEAAGGPVRVEVRSVNHRGLDVATRLPPQMSAFEPAVVSWCRSSFARGHIEIGVRPLSHDLSGHFEHVVSRRAESLRRVLAACQIPGAPSLQDVLALGVPSDEPQAFDGEAWARLRTVLDTAAGQVREARTQEGRVLADRLTEILGRARTLVGAIRECYPDELGSFRQRQETRLAFTAGARGAHDREPVALMVFGRDATEELDRLDAHASEFSRTVSGGGAVGRRLDFLATEMLREAATLTTKCPSPDLAQQAIGLRCELERLREQAQNVE